MKRALFVVAILLLPSAAMLFFQRALKPPSPTGPIPIATPAEIGSALPRLSRSVADVVRMSWVEPDPAGGHRLLFSVLGEEGWSPARTIAKGEDWFVNWADFPSLTAVDEQFLAAHWLVRSGSRSYDYDIHVSISRDGGDTWSPPIVPHRDGVSAEHGFVSGVAYRGELALAWLDGRNTVDPDGAMGLRFATLSREGRLGSEASLDERVCDCCQTAIAATSEGLVVAYRDRSPEEIRDISLVRLQDGRWSDPVGVGDDDWEIAGCPVNGPAVSTRGPSMAVAWYTGAGEEPVASLAFSDDGGESFGNAFRIDTGDVDGRVDLALLEDSSAAVSWLGADRIWVRRVDRDGELGPAVEIARVGDSRGAGFPQMALRADGLVFAWTEPNPDGSLVRTARLPLDRLPVKAPGS